MRTERWWWLAGFLILSVLIHIFLALHGPGFGLKGAAPTPKEIELTLEPLPPDKKPNTPKKIVVRPKPLPKAVAKTMPKIAVKPVVEKPVAHLVPKAAPRIRVARALPTVKPALTPAAHRVTPEALPEPVKTASVTPHMSHTHAALTMANPLAALATPEDKPEAESSASAVTPKITRSTSARTGLAGGASGGGQSAARGAQTPTERPTDSGLAGGMHFPKMASRIGGESIMSVKNPLAEDAVPEDKPGFSAGSGGGPGLGQGRGSGGLNGKMLASLRGGHGPGLGGGLGGGRGSGSGKGSGRGRGAGRGTGTGTSGSGDGESADTPEGNGDGNGFGLRAAVGGGGHRSGSGRLTAGGAFGDVGGLLRGEPARTSGDGQPGGNGHGLSAEIYEGRPYLTKLVHHRTDAFIDFNWGTSAAIIHGVSRVFSVRWTGRIEPRYSETYTLFTLEDDGFRVWIDGRLVINDWNDHKPFGSRCFIPMQAGRKYNIKVEYFENGIGHAEVHLRWFSPSQPLEVVPESALWQPE